MQCERIESTTHIIQQEKQTNISLKLENIVSHLFEKCIQSSQEEMRDKGAQTIRHIIRFTPSITNRLSEEIKQELEKKWEQQTRTPAYRMNIAIGENGHLNIEIKQSVLEPRNDPIHSRVDEIAAPLFVILGTIAVVLLVEISQGT